MCWQLTGHRSHTNNSNYNNNNNNMEDTRVMASVMEPRLGQNGKATKRRRLNAVLDKLASNIKILPGSSPPSPQARENASLEFEIQVKTAIKEESSESEESDSEKLKHKSPGSGSPCSLSSPTADQEYRDPLSVRLRSEGELTHQPEVNLYLPPPQQQQQPGSIHYQTFIKSQLLSNLYLQQYMTNNLANIAHLGSVGGGSVLSVTAAAAAANVAAPPPPSVTLTAVPGRSRPRRLAAAVDNAESLIAAAHSNCPAVPLDLSKRLELPPVATAASIPRVSTKISAFQSPAIATDAPLNLSAATLVKAAAESTGESSARLPDSGGGDKDLVLPPATAAVPTAEITAAVTTAEAVTAPAAGPPEVTSTECPICGQVFNQPERLTKHMATRHKSRGGDANGKAYYCHICKRSFARSDMLTRHVRLHTGIKPYTCQVCAQVFSRSDHLSTHQRTHTGEKPYRCNICPYSACRRDMITRHMRTHSRFESSDPAGDDEEQSVDDPSGGDGFESRDSDGDALVIKEETEEGNS